MSIKEQRRARFEEAVIERFKESGFLEVEIRVECLTRIGEGYLDGSVDAYWHFWNAALDSVDIELPGFEDYPASMEREMHGALRNVIEAAGLKVKP